MARTKLQARLGLPRSNCAAVDPVCQAIKKCGDRCTNPKKYGDFCGVHIPKEECPVCYETKRCERLECGHGLCKGCSDQWFATKTTCPMCREVVKPLIDQNEELEAFAHAYLALRMDELPDAQAARRSLEAIAPRSLISYFDLAV